MTPDQKFMLAKLAIEAVVGLIILLLQWASSPAGKKKIDAELSAVGTIIGSHLPVWAATLVAAKIAQLETTLDNSTGAQKMAALVAFAASRGITVPQSTLQDIYDDVKVAGVFCDAPCATDPAALPAIDTGGQ